MRSSLRACPHDTFAYGSRPVARVPTRETGMLVPVSRDYTATRNERARTVRDRSRPLDFVVWTLDPLTKSAAGITCLIDLLLPRYV